MALSIRWPTRCFLSCAASSASQSIFTADHDHIHIACFPGIYPGPRRILLYAASGLRLFFPAAE